MVDEEQPDPTAMVRATFDAVADTYDNVGVDMFGPIAAALVEQLAPRPGERALDVGCGRGAVLLRLGEAVSPGGRAVGVDLSPNMVALARSVAAEHGADVTVEVGDAVDPPVADAAFDLVASSLVLFFLPDPAAALRAWTTKLVPGGRMGVSTFGPYNEAWREVDRIFAPYVPKEALDPRTRSDDSPFGSDEGMERLVGDAGFVDVRTVSLTVPVRFVDADQWHRWTWSTGQRRMWEAVPEAERAAVLDEGRRRVEAARAPDGGMGFDQGVRLTLAVRGA